MIAEVSPSIHGVDVDDRRPGVVILMEGGLYLKHVSSSMGDLRILPINTGPNRTVFIALMEKIQRAGSVINITDELPSSDVLSFDDLIIGSMVE